MTSNVSTGFNMKPSESEDALLDKQIDDIYQGLREGVDREVERREREGLPIYVEENGIVVDLQKNPGRENHT